MRERTKAYFRRVAGGRSSESPGRGGCGCGSGGCGAALSSGNWAAGRSGVNGSASAGGSTSGGCSGCSAAGGCAAVNKSRFVEHSADDLELGRSDHVGDAEDHDMTVCN